MLTFTSDVDVLVIGAGPTGEPQTTTCHHSLQLLLTCTLQVLVLPSDLTTW